jgi:hypothetical protein
MSDVTGDASPPLSPAPPPSRFVDWSLQIAHRAAIVAMFLLITGVSLRYFKKDAALVLPVALGLAALVTLVGSGAWWRTRGTGRSTSESRGLAIVGAILLIFGLVMMISRPGKS